MRKILLMAATVLAAACAAWAQDAARLTVMSYNLHGGIDATPEEIAQTINAEHPDFVALQEVDAYAKRSRAPWNSGQNVIAKIAAATDMFPVYGRAIDFAGGYYGIGLLSRHPVVESRVIPLPNPDSLEARALVEATVLIDGRHPATFACTHLSYETVPSQVAQAAFIADHFKHSKHPVILGGDFNAAPGSEAIDILQAAMTNLTGEEPTFPADEPREKIDFIFGSAGVSAIGAKVAQPQGKPMSDHRPVVASVAVDLAPQQAEYGIRDLCLIYQGGSHRIDWTEADFIPYVSHRFADGSRDWTFDGFLFLELRDDVKEMRFEPFCMRQAGYRDSRKEDWEFYLDRLFEPGKSLDALDKTIAKFKGEIGDPGFKHKIVLTVLPPCRGLDYWGELDGRKISFSDEKFKAGDYADAVAACSWFLDKLLDRYAQQGYDNLQLAGIYWLAEDRYACYELPKLIAPLVKAKGLNFVWIPYFKADGYDQWSEYGFDYAYHQPNHFFSKSVPDERIDQAIDLAREYGLDMEFEFDSSARHDLDGSNYDRMKAYIDRFAERGVFATTPLAYYTGSYGLIDLDRSGSPEDQAITDRLFRIISERRKLLPAATR